MLLFFLVRRVEDDGDDDADADGSFDSSPSKRQKSKGKSPGRPKKAVSGVLIQFEDPTIADAYASPLPYPQDSIFFWHDHGLIFTLFFSPAATASTSAP
jgi:hypothetical protein